MDVTTALEFGKTFGFPALCLGVVVYLLCRAAVWAANEILIPFRDRWFKHADNIEACMQSLDGRTARMEVAQPQICRVPLQRPKPTDPNIDFGKPSIRPA